MNFDQLNKEIEELNILAMEQAKSRWNSIAKPLNSLGKLEKGIIHIAGIQGTHKVEVDRKALVIMCADNGVVEEGVTQTGQEVTAVVAGNFRKRKTTVSIMCEKSGVDIYPVDIGMAFDSDIIQKKIARGTKNFAKEAAMSKEQALDAIHIGMQMVKELKEKGYHIIATGEMGIGNTTTSSGMAAVFLNKPVEEVTGKGAGLSSSGLETKIRVIKEAIKLHNVNQTSGALEVLAKLGGYDIAGLVGIYLGGAVYKVPIVIDGFISAVAALTAIKLCPKARDYIIPSHVSSEPAGKMMLEALNLSPYLTCDMCLGEGSGAVMLFDILETALLVYKEMSTFQEIKIEKYKPL